MQLSQQKKRGNTPANDQSHPSHQQRYPQDEPGVHSLPLAVHVYGLDVLVIAVVVQCFHFGRDGLLRFPRRALFFARALLFCLLPLGRGLSRAFSAAGCASTCKDSPQDGQKEKAPRGSRHRSRGSISQAITPRSVPLQAPILDVTILAWDFSLVIGGECAIFLPFCFHPIRPVEYPNIVITLVKPLFYNIYSKREKRAPALRKQNNTATQSRVAVSLFVQEIGGKDGWHHRTGEILDFASKDVACAAPLGHCIHHRILKIRHSPHEGSVYVHTLYIGKAHDLGELIDMFFGLLCRPKGFTKHIENIGSDGCGDQTLGVIFKSPAQSR